MQLKLQFDPFKPISGEASILIDKSACEVFCFVAENFFANYPKWATEIVALSPIDCNCACEGARAKQIRNDDGSLIESIFEITEFRPHGKFTLTGITAPYRQTFTIEEPEGNNLTRLSFKFELLDVDIFMRPFEKLIRVAIEDGAENTIENIKKLLSV